MRSLLTGVPTGVIAAGSLVTGFAVAEVTGVRALGGVVLLAGVALCWPRWRRRAGTRSAAALVLAYALAFAGAHPLATLLGPWPSVLAVSVAMGLLAFGVADRRVSSPT